MLIRFSRFSRMATSRPRRWIFLDIDGVLNNTDFLKHAKRKHEDDFDLTNARAVAFLARHSRAKIVISSTWRMIYSLSRLRLKLRAFGITAPLVGATPVLRSGFMSRSDEIAAYMAIKRLELDDVLILDDDPLHEILAVRQVRPDFNVGMTHADALRGLHIWGINGHG